MTDDPEYRAADFGSSPSRTLGEGTGSSPSRAIAHRAMQFGDGKYEVIDVLGRGGMGIVYRVCHGKLGRDFALKVLQAPLKALPSQSKRKMEALERFRREALILGKLRSTHIVDVTDVGTSEDGSPYLVMELLDGQTLADALSADVLSVARVAKLAVQICRGLEKAHAAGVVHRDLKPANIFLTRNDAGEEVVKILDFGVAKLLGEGEHADVTQTNTAIGTPLYMSPEQASGLNDVDARADIYSVGAMLYEMLSGQLPHPGTSAGAVLFDIQSKEPRRLDSLSRHVPRALVALVHQALAKDRRKRQTSAAELERALVPFASSRVELEVASTRPAAQTLDEPGSAEGTRPSSTASDSLRREAASAEPSSDATSSTDGAAKPASSPTAPASSRWVLVATVGAALIGVALVLSARSTPAPHAPRPAQVSPTLSEPERALGVTAGTPEPAPDPSPPESKPAPRPSAGQAPSKRPMAARRATPSAPGGSTTNPKRESAARASKPALPARVPLLPPPPRER